MTARLQPHFVDPKSRVLFNQSGHGIIAQGTTVPTDATAGYATGCLFFQNDGTEDTALYVNDGSATSCDFNAIPTNSAVSSAELGLLASPTLTTGAGVGITAGTGTVYKSSRRKVGGIYYGTILIDLTGLGTSTTDLDVIGVAGGPAHIGQYTVADLGTLLGIRMTCLELPATGADDIDLYSATVGTAVFDDGIAALTETALITSGAAWASGTVKAAALMPTANDYLYLVNGEAGTVGTYTAGKFLIELYGYDA
jgi:NADPH-dependent curcumin reductase CurA